MKYKNEKDHDKCLISLVKDLDREGQLDIVRQEFQIENNLEQLTHAQRRNVFDVELTFSNVSVVIETKVHSDENGNSDEGGRWNGEWQTDRIVRITRSSDYLNYLKEDKIYLFITYGTSEFYTKPYEAGPASSDFKHVGLDRMIGLVDSAVRVLPKDTAEKYQEWLRLMKIEREKREKAVELLQYFSTFRTQYLTIHGENDFPRNRFLFCAPELAFPVLGSLAQQWNESEHVNEFGKVSLYPISRNSPPADSVLNFWEMWKSSEWRSARLAPGSIHAESGLYFEINEDFNLNVKIENRRECDDRIRDSLKDATWPDFVNGTCRYYKQGKQGPFVLYEIDFGFLRELNDMPRVMSNLVDTLRVAIGALRVRL